MGEQRLVDVNNLGVGKVNPDAFECKDYAYGWNNALQAVIEAAPTIDPETLPVVKELRKQLARIMAERDAAVGALAKAKSCEACAHAGVFAAGACETADYECAACPAACTCRDCRDGSRWKWKGDRGHEIP